MNSANLNIRSAFIYSFLIIIYLVNEYKLFNTPQQFYCGLQLFALIYSISQTIIAVNPGCEMHIAYTHQLPVKFKCIQ